MKSLVNVVAAQFEPYLGEIDKNVSMVSRLIANIMDEKPKTDIIVFPELALSGYSCWSLFPEIAQPTNSSKSINKLSKIAKKSKVKIVIGYPEKDVLHNSVHNSAIFIDEFGDILCNYRKVHILPHEKDSFTAGDRFILCKTNCGNIGILICWDAAFPEPSRLYALNDADFIVVLAAWEDPYDREWELAIKARAFDNGLPIVASNIIGKENSFHFFGKSAIVDSMGRIQGITQKYTQDYIYHTISKKDRDFNRKNFVTQLNEIQLDLYNKNSLKILNFNK